MPHHVIDNFVAIDVPLAWALGVIHVDPEGVEVARVVRDPVGEDLVRLGVQLRRGGVQGEELVVDRCWHGGPNRSALRAVVRRGADPSAVVVRTHLP